MSALSFISPPYQALDGKRASELCKPLIATSYESRIFYTEENTLTEKVNFYCFLQDTDLKLGEAKCAWKFFLHVVINATVEFTGGNEAKILQK